MIDGWCISCEIALIWMSLDLNDEKSTLVQVMAWCHQTASNYLSQCWPRSLSPYGVTRPQWVKLVIFKLISRIHILGISCEIPHRWMSQDLTILVHVTVNGLVPKWIKPIPEPIWPSSMTLHGVTRPQCVKAEARWPLSGPLRVWLMISLHCFRQWLGA